MPDVLVLGPFNIPTYGVSLIVGVLVFSALVPRLASTFSLGRAIAEEVASRAVLGLIVGAKLADVLRSPATFLARPRLLLALPRGPEPLIGALLGMVLFTLPVWWPARRHAVGLLDIVAVPLLTMGAVVSAGSGGPRAVPLGLGFALAAAATYALRTRGRFPGHVALAAVVFGSLAVAAGDLLGPAPVSPFGVSGTQLAAGAAGGGAYVAALWLERRVGRAPLQPQTPHPTAGG
ncbi:prolipoprotein diacylglyceryl transferase family protein [Caldinitratiruptor microaerophilus]|uniref:Uncharacterized protein n=1 Tax=Caldinitratiruptor microaerophilus TaxID=671077 RepID=A0AA35CKV7_9FIRM|nr:prolipoprotein diacylglyceryl transferase family protein [Caldinitratiruptor microaerophilus]BDG61170.1 hypothetical protein caldi_22600 [Caldinitratiruptor microaerophilus]